MVLARDRRRSRFPADCEEFLHVEPRVDLRDRRVVGGALSNAAPYPPGRGAGLRKLRTRTAVIATAAGAASVTAAVAAVPSLHFAYRNRELHVALLTAEALIALFSAFLLLGRLRRRGALEDLLLCMALAVLAVSNLLFAAVPAVISTDTSVFSTWSSLLGRLLGATLFAAAAIVPSRRLHLSNGQRAVVWAAVAAVLGIIALAVGWFEPRLPSGVSVAPAETSNRPRLEGTPAVLAAQVAGFGLLAAAAIGLTARAERTGDALLHWLAIGAVLSAAARANYFLYPSLFTDFVYVGDGFRLLFYVVVLLAALSEIRLYWRSQAEAATLSERHRIARELHDGLAQELAGIRRNLHWLEQDNRFVDRARASTERAIAESRRLLAALAEAHVGSLDVALATAGREIGEREGSQVIVSVDEAVRLPPAQREALVKIASEAITNAARHGQADVIRVEVTGGGRPRLRIEDSGRGFDPAAPQPPGHYGLQTMRERAEQIGAELRLDSQAGKGTRIEVVL
jgi:signal transduction histidine kinase